jgi:hypothetical protein
MGEWFYVYAITPSGCAVPPGLCGLDDMPLGRVDHGEMAAVVSVWPEGAVAPSVERVLRHAAVLDALRRVQPALPVRFGTLLHGASAVRDALATHAVALRADLVRLGSAVEYGVTAVWDPPAPEAAPAGVAAGTGAAYMAARLRAHRHAAWLHDRAHDTAQEVRRSLAPLARDARLDILPAECLPVRAAFLLDPEDQPAFQAAFERLRATSGATRYLLSGPWPPSTFVTPLGPDRRALVHGLLREASEVLAAEDARRPAGGLH